MGTLKGIWRVQKIWHRWALCFVSCCFTPSYGPVNCSIDNLESGFPFIYLVYKSFFCWSSGVMSCTTQPACQRLNYNLAEKSCECNNDTKHFQAKCFVEKPTFVYAENPGSATILLFSWNLRNNICFLTLCSRYFASVTDSISCERFWEIVFHYFCFVSGFFLPLCQGSANLFC